MREAHNSTRHAFVLLIARVHTSSCCVSDRPIGLVSGEVSFFACEPCERVSMNRGGMHPSTCGVGRRASSNGLGSPFFREGGLKFRRSDIMAAAAAATLRDSTRCRQDPSASLPSVFVLAQVHDPGYSQGAPPIVVLVFHRANRPARKTGFSRASSVRGPRFRRIDHGPGTGLGPDP